MTLVPSGVFSDGNRAILAMDSTGHVLPATGEDARYGFGGATIAGTTQRMLVNQLLPTGVCMVQSVIGAETNTFTTRVAIQGTLLAPSNYPTLPTAGTFPAGSLNMLGRTVRITGGGNSGTTGTPDFTIDVGLGAGVLATTGANARVAATSPQNFWFQVISTCTTIGATGVMTSTGVLVWQSTALVGANWQMANSTVGTGLTADLTAALALTVNATCGTSNAANRVRLTNLTVEILY